MRYTLWTVLLFSGMAAAQPFGAGLKVGTTLTDAVHAIGTNSIPSTQHLIAGPYLEVRLPFSLAVEGDALYELGLFSDAVSGGSTWQFPILLKYRMLKGPLRPYIEGGPSFSRITDIAEIPSLIHRSNYGGVIGVGVELKLLVLRVSPEIRYNMWALRNLRSPLGIFESNHNIATFTVGIGF